MPTLLVMRGARYVRKIRVQEGDTRIGRSARNEIVLASDKVSKLHAVLTCQGPFATVKDARSTNGTCVNGEWVDSIPVLDGDRLKLADVELLYCQKDDPTAEIADVWRAEVEDEAATSLAGLVVTESAPAAVARKSAPSSAYRAQSVGEGVAFSLLLRGREVSALITYDALATHFGAYAYGEDGCSRAVDAYETNLLAINVAATYRYEALRQEPVVLRSRDF